MQIHPQYKIYQLNSNNFDYAKLWKFFISILWCASIYIKICYSNIGLPYRNYV